ncbi:sensor histidine kinase [Thermodesulfobacteriota bacterium]
MDQDNTIVCQETLQYFKAMLPSFSHEAKNVLAVINENAGLMADYILMAQKGKALDLERLSSLSTAIKKQVARFNTLITDVRQVAHGIDNNTETICLVHHTRQVSELLSTKAAMRSIQFHVSAMEEPILIHTRPVLLLHIMWVCLDYAMQAGEQGRHIELSLEKKSDNAVVLMSGIDKLRPESIAAIMPDKQRNTVLSALNAELVIDENEKTLLLKIGKHHA